MTTLNATVQDEAFRNAESTNPTQHSTNETDDDRASPEDPSSPGDGGPDGFPGHFLTIEGVNIFLDKNGKVLGTNTAAVHGPLEGSICSAPLEGIDEWVEGIDHAFSPRLVKGCSNLSSKDWHGPKEVVEDEKILSQIMQDHTNRCINRIQNPSSVSRCNISSKTEGEKLTLISNTDAGLYNSLMNASEEIQNRTDRFEKLKDRISRSGELPLEHRKIRWLSRGDYLDVESYKGTEVGCQVVLEWESIWEDHWPEYVSKLNENSQSLEPIGRNPGSTFMGTISKGPEVHNIPKINLNDYKAKRLY